MIITPVDDKNNLYLIEDVFPDDLLNKINQEDFMSYEWQFQEGQFDWPRRQLIVKPWNILVEVDNHLNKFRQYIADSLNVHFPEYDCWSAFWLDLPTFTCPTHLDGDLPIAMQVYLLEKAGSEHGTVFYNSDDSIRYTFPYKVNTGYIMLNGPGQFHGVPTTLNDGELRMSSYTYFGSYEHK